MFKHIVPQTNLKWGFHCFRKQLPELLSQELSAVDFYTIGSSVTVEE